MSRTLYLAIVFSLALLAGQLAAQNGATIERVSVRGSSDAMEVEIQTSGASLAPNTQAITGPDRIIVDFPGARPSSDLRALPVNRGPLKGIRSGLFFDNPPITRIVLDLNQAQPYQISTTPNTVVVKLGASENPAQNSAQKPAQNTASSKADIPNTAARNQSAPNQIAPSPLPGTAPGPQLRQAIVSSSPVSGSPARLSPANASVANRVIANANMADANTPKPKAKSAKSKTANAETMADISTGSIQIVRVPIVRPASAPASTAPPTSPNGAATQNGPATRNAVPPLSSGATSAAAAPGTITPALTITAKALIPTPLAASSIPTPSAAMPAPTAAPSIPTPNAGPTVANAIAATAAPVAPAEPPKPQVNVSYENGLLSIHSEKATLSQVLYEVHMKTQADIAIPAGAEQEQVVTNLGPGPARDVLAALLNGSSYNFIFIGNELTLERVILTRRDPNAF